MSTISLSLYFVLLVLCGTCLGQAWQNIKPYQFNYISTTIDTRNKTGCDILVNEILNVTLDEQQNTIITRTIPNYIVAQGNPIIVKNATARYYSNNNTSTIEVSIVQDQDQGAVISITLKNNSIVALDYTLSGYEVSIDDYRNKISYSFQSEAVIRSCNFTLLYDPSSAVTPYSSQNYKITSPGVMWVQRQNSLEATKGWIVDAYVSGSNQCFYVPDQTKLTIILGSTLTFALAGVVLFIMLAEYATDRVNGYYKGGVTYNRENISASTR
ncbi:volA [Acrasis kona]|uniref:VolA n=1 Tax=Acrasis kona TaxID=1008807 RepID=A0AAW2ZQM5_9EUKA